MRFPGRLGYLLAPTFSLGAVVCLAQAPTHGQSSGGCQSSWVQQFAGAAGTDHPVFALQEFEDSVGPALYAGGAFWVVGLVNARGIARWDGANWSAPAPQMSGSVYALAPFSTASGPRLYVAGEFLLDIGGGFVVKRIASWDGANWGDLGIGIDNNQHDAVVYALETFDDGTGDALYAGGYFTWASGASTLSIGRWDGASWSGVGGGTNGYILALEVHDDGTGAALYAGGSFTSAGTTSVLNVAKWDGASWIALDAGLAGGVNTLVTFDDGSGPALYAGGNFMLSGSTSVAHVARWDGIHWLPLGNGLTGGPFSAVRALTVYDDGAGPTLYAAGAFTNSGATPVSNVAKWTGSSWVDMGGGTDFSTNTLAGYGKGAARSLYVGGLFHHSGGLPAENLALWANQPGCGQPGVPFCDPGAGGVIACPCGNAPFFSGLGCDNSAYTGGTDLTATGISRVTYDSVVLTSSGEKPTATSIVLQGSSASSTGTVFGQGVRCVAGSLKRLYVKTASNGSITAPEPADAQIVERSAALGDTIAAGTHRYYGVYYRDPTVLGGCPSTSTFNITHQLDVLWAP